MACSAMWTQCAPLAVSVNIMFTECQSKSHDQLQSLRVCDG